MSHVNPNENKTMNRPLLSLRSLFRAGLLVALLLSPMALMSTVNAGTGATIDAPVQAKKGLGLVLLVSLQRG
jgi:hypothetical protein